jgi:hypothetical protein
MDVLPRAVSKLKNAKERALVQEWLALPNGERTPEKLADIGQDIFGLPEVEDREKALQKAVQVLSKKNVDYAVKLTLRRRALTTPEHLEEGATKGLNFLTDTLEWATEGERGDDSKARSVAVRAATTLVSSWVKERSGAPTDKVEILKQELDQLGDDFSALADMDPKKLMELAEGGNDGKPSGV